ncbi:MAG: DNA-directed RNA polymerase subunit beta' [Fibrobacteres bacterium]|nr:DNA-directed RNA polymerase subunit beta' [Fibrobacterota bacterium]
MNETATGFDSAVPDTGAISIQLASPEVIRGWSFGEVTKPETINYRTFKPEKDGLFCEKIFGPVKNWECSCGKYKRIRYRGVVCDRCGVEVTHSKVRRERMGHIELAVPVVHIWFFKSLPSMIGQMLGMSITHLERVIYYESYLVLNPGNTELKRAQLLTEDEHIELEDEGKEFDAKMGAPAVKQMLAELDLEHLSRDLRARVKVETSVQRKLDTLKRLRIVEAFRKSENRPEWMVLDVLPVIPPDLRPLVPLEGGRFATSDLNDLYRRVINRNNRLKKLIDIKAPEVILRNEKRMLQEAVDVLFDNGRRTVSVKGEGRRPLKSLSELLKGKNGRFRQNLLGKRVDYSGRSVIVVGPELKIFQCGLPKSMALELYKPFIIQKLEERGIAHTVKSAKKYIEKEKPEVWDILEEIIQDHPVLLNRAPTLHRLGIQAFYPTLVEGKAIRLHPLVCAAFNADFDGDQMAVHLPLSFEAQLEARILMLSAFNLLHPASGQPITVPSQDIVLGAYYLTKPAGPKPDKPEQIAKLRVFGSVLELEQAVNGGGIRVHEWIRFRFQDKMIVTTVGRGIFSKILPKQMGLVNETMSKKQLGVVIGDVYRKAGNNGTVEFLDNLKSTGFLWATKSGSSVGLGDMLIPDDKWKIIDEAQKKVDNLHDLYDNGVITDGERYNQVIDTWSHATSEVANILFDKLAKDQDGFNPIYMMADSGARGSREQIKQLSGMRGLMQKPQKKLTGQETIENPIKSNFKEGLTVLEYFISTHGARKGLADTALKTADAGYLTRRLVDVAQDLVISEVECGAKQGIEVGAITEGDDVKTPLSERIIGRVPLNDVLHPLTNKVIVEAGTIVDEALSKALMDAEIDRVLVRSVLTCESRRGVCAKCYGRNLATGRPVNIGEAVGVMAAQSIGEPGTQLTLRTFHIGGAATRLTAQDKQKAKIDSTVRLENVETVLRGGKDMVVISRTGECTIVDDNGITKSRYPVPYGSVLRVEEGKKVKAGTVLFEWDPYNSVIVAKEDGLVRWDDIEDGHTLEVEEDENTGLTTFRVCNDKKGKLHPQLLVFGADKEKPIGRYPVPANAVLQVRDNTKIGIGEILVKMPRQASATRDITGGLPRVAELFEARVPKAPAVVTAVDGIIEFGEMERGQQNVIVSDENGVKHEYLIPRGKHLSVHSGDRVRAGDRLCEGPKDPHDILKIGGEKAVQEYLVEEIQAVYKLQGVTIADKHIECIVRQMLRKVKIKDPGDSQFLENEEVSKARLRLENIRIESIKGDIPTIDPLLLGITKASLGTDSFFAAASFQETTKVLTQVAVAGKTDTLEGLKENVIVGRLIPSGTGARTYGNIRVRDEEAEVEAARRAQEKIQEDARRRELEAALAAADEDDDLEEELEEEVQVQQ